MLLKQIRPFFQVEPLVLRKFSDIPSLCVYSLLKIYMEKTSAIRENTTRLLLMTRKPHHAVTSQTIARWIKTILKKAGIDTNIFGAHSTRSADTCAASSTGLSLTTIMNAAGWSNAGTFQKFCNRPVPSENLGLSVLSNYAKVSDCTS
jgi:site-specific recombinase XerD